MLSLPLEPVCREETLRYMGYTGEPDIPLTAILNQCEKILLKVAQPRVIYRLLPLERSEFGLFAGAMPLKGNDIAAHLEGCDRILLLAATLSGQVDQAIHRAGISDMTQSLTLDAMASAGIEQVCNRLEQILQQQFPNTWFTWRFSAGYGDLPLSMQPQILEILDAQKRLGLTVTPEHILIPRKSVTAIIGLAEHPLKRGVRGCATCNLRNTCPYRKKGAYCGGTSHS